jgi:hypothetical protein
MAASAARSSECQAEVVPSLPARAGIPQVAASSRATRGRSPATSSTRRILANQAAFEQKLGEVMLTKKGALQVLARMPSSGRLPPITIRTAGASCAVSPIGTGTAMTSYPAERLVRHQEPAFGP